MYGIFLDLETSGLDSTRHRVLECALCVLDLATGEPLTSLQSLVRQPQSVWEQRDPISIEVNGMNFELISQGLSETQLEEKIITLMKDHQLTRENAVFICQNPSFDRIFFTQIVATYKQENLNWPYHWLDLASMYWAINIQAKNKSLSQVEKNLSLSKNVIARAYGLPEEEAPHRAMNGVKHLISCYAEVVGWPDAPQTRSNGPL